MYYPHYQTSLRYAFTLQCPNLDHQLTLSMFHDGTVRGDIHFYDVCKVADSVTIAYNSWPSEFGLDQEAQTMLEYPVIPVSGWYLQIPYDWEIIKPFLDHYSLTPTWIDCDGISGIFDDETGAWTGAVGKVRNCNISFINI